MKKLIFLLALPLLFIFQSCDEEKSNKNDILDYSIVSSSYAELDVETKVISTVEKKVFVAISNTEIESIFPLSITPQIKISSGAKIIPESGEMIVFNTPDDIVNYEVTSEDGSKKSWILQLVHKQIQNSDFQTWYSVNLTTTVGYKEVGLSGNTTLWASANAGTSSYSVYNTLPYVQGEDTMVLIKTDEAGLIPIAAGTLFAGKFNLAGAITNPTDPKKATALGIPYFWRPVSMRFLFKYTAGDDYIKATLDDPGNLFGGFTETEEIGEDSCSIYAILEKRTNDDILEIGRANFVSETTADFAEQTINFVYSSSEIPTHISIVFTSSKYGDFWTGAQGSELIIDDLELIY